MAVSHRPGLAVWSFMRHLLLVLLLGGCSVFEPHADALPNGAVPLAPPSYFADLWHEVEQCSGLTRSMSEVSFFVTPDNFTLADGTLAQGAFLYRSNRLVLSAGMLDTIVSPIYHRQVIRHEIAHAILDKFMLHGHVAAFFNEKCGAIAH